MPDQDPQPASYNYQEMMERLKKTQGQGFSRRSGRKLKRRSHQPHKSARRTGVLVFLLVLAAVIA